MTSSYQVWDAWIEQSKTKRIANPDLIKSIHFYADLISSFDVGIYARMSYGVPFLYKYGPIGYFNTDKQGLYFAFYWGKLLLDSEGSEVLVIDDKKMVKRVYLKMDGINDEFIASFISLFQEAFIVDTQKYQK